MIDVKCVLVGNITAFQHSPMHVSNTYKNIYK